MAEDGWRALARFLAAEQRARGIRTRQDFAAHIGISRRTLDNLLAARRASYSDRTLAAVEYALMWQPGSVQRVLEGGRPTRARDREMERLMRLWPELTPQARRMLIAVAEAAIKMSNTH